MQNTNVNGKHKAAFALRIIKGLGRRFTILTLKIAQIDLNKRAGELNEADIEKILLGADKKLFKPDKSSGVEEDPLAGLG